MNLIAYSDSDDSGDDVPSVPKPVAKPTPKPAFQKVVDRTNPGRIKLNLPGASQQKPQKDDIEAEAPPAKRARVGGGTLGGFNAMLPAPKRPKVDATQEASSLGKRGLGKGLGAGVNLRTGAEPAFKRESRVEEAEYDETGNPVKKEPLNKNDFRALLNLPTPEFEKKEVQKSLAPGDVVKDGEPEALPLARPKFMPMSVTRGKKKKPVKSGTAASEEIKQRTASAPKLATSKPTLIAKPKVSLFSISQETDGPAKSKPSEHYQPLLYGFDEDDEASVPDDEFDVGLTNQQPAPSSALPHAPAATDNLTSIASELNLSEAERRQLFGRKGQEPDFAAARIVEFNTDSEYAHNEMLRQQGETVQHNALKSISGTGKNSLRSLVNVATTQKDALEEHFTTGKRNKTEAGNRYGWS